MKKRSFFPFTNQQDAPPPRPCDQLGCEEAGEFRAPKSPDQLNEHYWFCLIHVREYNKNWNFYQGMNIEQVEAMRVSDITWNRPSWPLGNRKVLLERFDLMGHLRTKLMEEEIVFSHLPQEIQEATVVLNISYPITLDALKKHYKSLAKIYHPDLNSGSKEAEERLKVINVAYQILKNHLS